MTGVIIDVFADILANTRYFSGGELARHGAKKVCLQAVSLGKLTVGEMA